MNRYFSVYNDTVKRKCPCSHQRGKRKYSYHIQVPVFGLYLVLTKDSHTRMSRHIVGYMCFLKHTFRVKPESCVRAYET